jgi:hypothetical protein
MAPDGQSARPVTDADAFCADWAPDSRSLVFQRGAEGATDLRTISLDGNLRRVTMTPGAYAGVRWAP